MPRFMADSSVGHSAVGSVADTISAFAPLETAAWIAGICDAGVADVPLVSLPVSPSAWSAAMAPPELALSAVGKYELPRFFGMTKTFRPVFRPAVEAALDEPALDAAALDDAGADELAEVAELEELELQAATATVGTMGSASASFLARLRVISLYPFNSFAGDTSWLVGLVASAGLRWATAGGPGGGRRTARGLRWAGRRWRAAGRR